ncbi:hypothetical protein BJV82DRAFT_614384 [Fennellomyces sp. T-0311]|nr:hypothetical protein BJV82DRAFT_614384 [Fennellomyces sp. T-0311]
MSVQGFWGLRVEPKKTYSQVVQAPFRVSMASLGDDIKGKARTSLWVKVDKNDFVLCSLTPEKTEQQPLDITFVEGEEVTFTAKGSNTIHLTGNYIFDDEDDEAGAANISDIAALLNERRGLVDDEAEVSGEDSSDEDEEDEMHEDEDMEEDEDEEEEEEEEEEAVKPAKKDKKRPAEAEQDKPSKKAKADEAAQKQQELKKQQEQKKAEELKKKQEQKKAEELKKKQQEQKKAEELKKKQEKKKQEEAKKAEPQIKKLPNGLVIEEVELGEGTEVAKAGRKVGMRYIGKLLNGKVFDKNISGRPFFFNLGRGEVIKGWDIGVAGMKMGGSRKLTIPAALAYGKRGAPPDIPKNATLVFDIKLVALK